MKIIWVGALALLALSGCVVHRHHHHGPPPAPAPKPAARATVSVQVGWTHVRYSIWAEYYGCSDEEIYYLENCGYDDDDLLVLCFVARRARVPLRWVLWDYDRCGRSLYTVALAYRLDPYAFYCADVPRFYRCPPVYARAYGYYWRNERPYLRNDECHALVHLQIGLRYYGYSHDQYFQHHEQSVQRADRHVFRTIVVRDHPRAGHGGKTVHDTGIVKRERAWEARDIKEWEKKRETAREQVKIRHTPEHERQEAEKAKRASEADDRRRAFEEARQRAETARRERDEHDKRNPSDHRPGNPDAGKRPDDKDAGRVPPPRDGAPKKDDRGSAPGLEHKEASGPAGPPKLSDEDRRKGPSSPEPKGPARSQDEDARKGPPSKAEDSPRGPEKAPAKREADDNRQPPPRKSEESPRGPEKAPPPPPKRDAEDNRQPPPRKADDSPRGAEKTPPPPPPPKRSDDNRKPPPPPPKSEEQRGPEKPPPKKSDENKKDSEREKPRGR